MVIRSPFPEDVVLKLGANTVFDSWMFEEERQLAETWASASRLSSFRAGRSLAHAAIEQLGEPHAPLLRGERGEVLWPDGLVGSISHSSAHAVACVARKETYQSLGIDIEERARAIRIELAERICTASEREWVGSDTRKLLQVFSAKECFYKLVSPLREKPLGFQAVELRWQDGAFRAVLLHDPYGKLPAGFEATIYYSESDELLLSAAYLHRGTK